MLINVKMPTIVGILKFMSRINFVLSCVEHGIVYYNLGAIACSVYVVGLSSFLLSEHVNVTIMLVLSLTYLQVDWL